MGATPKRVQASISSFFKTKPTAVSAEPTAAAASAIAAEKVEPPASVKKTRSAGASPARTAIKRQRKAETPQPIPAPTTPEDDQTEADEDEDSTDQQLASTTMLFSNLHVQGTHVQVVHRTLHKKYTPLEAQVLDVKAQHPSTLLAVEVGYKYRFFGEDARIASQVLGIMCTQAKNTNFYNASVPAPRLLVHVRRLVLAGFRVGIVRQQETAAVKATGENRSAPFVRQLAEVYTVGTMLEEVGAEEQGRAPWIVSISQQSNGRRTGLVAAQVSTGMLLMDEFGDDAMCGELATRLEHIAPAELLLPAGLARDTRLALAAYCGRPIGAEAPGPPGEEPPLLEHVGRPGPRIARLAPAAAVVSAAEQCARLGIAAAPGVLDMPALASAALAQLLAYLAPMGLAQGIMAQGAPEPFHTQAHMLLSQTTLRALDVFGAQQSLFATMDRTCTAPGRRLLRRWVGHPLADLRRLQERADAVGWLRDRAQGGAGCWAAAARAGLARVGVDLDRGLCRILHVQAQPPELLRIMDGFARAARVVGAIEGQGQGQAQAQAQAQGQAQGQAQAQAPGLLAGALRALAARSASVGGLVQGWLAQMDRTQARGGHKPQLFTPASAHHAELRRHHTQIAALTQALDLGAESVGRQLKQPGFAFRSVSGVEYLIDVRRTQAVPGDWLRAGNGTKTHLRYQTPDAVRLLAERERRRADLAAAAARAYAGFLGEVAADGLAELHALVSALATLDALLALAELAATPGYTQPTLSDAPEAHLRLVDAVHPMAAAQQPGYVANSLSLGGGTEAPGPRALVLTGPNAGGKSSLARTAALVAIMAQAGSFVPARQAQLSLLDGIHVRMGAHDNILRGESTFMVEMRETAGILRRCTPKSLALLDELGRGTSTHDGAAIAYAVLAQLLEARPMVLFVTHYAHVAAGFARDPRVAAAHMAFVEKSAAAEAGAVPEIAFLYRLAEGVSADSFGLNVARIAGLPHSLLVRAQDCAQRMRVDIESRRAATQARALQAAVAKHKKGLC
ncbi:Mismatch repair protein msh3 [Kickxella alabastrina]|uniref:Mismatch repair protein msh3 n=1 Tax=Kickxella alabastrina TaxID=61397 RepID=A0ACC1IT47_9FUNG|nr:Mismatch repair protein msh3 [Kickxella alabastrina]